LSLVACYSYRPVPPITPVAPLEAGRHFLASLLHVHNYAYGPWHPRAINTVTWSLEVEVQFYVLAPLLARVLLLGSASARRGAIVLACAASVALSHALRAGGPELPPSLLTYAPYFGAGLLLAELHEPGRRTDRRRAPWDILALAAWGAAPFVSAAHPPAQHLVVASVLFIAVYASLRSGGVLAILSSAPLRLVGGMCYSIYLLHHIAIWVPWRWPAIPRPYPSAEVSTAP